MEIIGTAHGKKIRRDCYDLDYIQLDVVEDLVRSIEPTETNPNAKIEVDLTYPDQPRYHLSGCCPDFERRFFQLLGKDQPV